MINSFSKECCDTSIDEMMVFSTNDTETSEYPIHKNEAKPHTLDEYDI